MRILNLDLRAFGPFTNLSLPLDAGNFGLHLVYGPNEAGKTSALRALRQFFYGIPHNSGDDFIHRYPDLRIGTVLSSSKGDVLDCIRRKAAKHPLRDGQDNETIDPGLLSQMLGGIDRETFETRFGLDYDELSRGGSEIIKGEGNLGETLFAAGAGVGDLKKLRADLAKEADDLFKSAGRNPKINESISKYKQARKQITEAQLTSGDWEQHDRSHQQAILKRDETSRLLLDKDGQKRRLERIVEALPYIAERTRLRGELVELKDAIVLSDGFAERRYKAVTRLTALEETREQANQEVTRLTKAIDEVHVPERLIAHQDTIERLHEQMGAYRGARDDRPGLESRLEQLDRDARDVLIALGNADTSLADADSLRLDVATQSRIRNLANQQQAVLERCKTAIKAVRELEAESRRAKQELAQRDVPGDAEELRQAVAAAQRGELSHRRTNISRELAELNEQFAIDLASLPLWSGDCEALEKLPLPGAESIDRFDRELTESANETKRLSRQVEEWIEGIATVREQIQQLSQTHDVPSEADLNDARQRRDEGWTLVRQAWQLDEWSEDQAGDFIATFPPAESLAQAYQLSVTRADQLADQLRAAADQVARKATLTARLDKNEAQLEKDQARLQRHREHALQQDQDWRDLWLPVAIEPRSPREMRTWLVQQGELVSRAKVIRQIEADLKGLRKQLDVHCESLLKGFEQLGETPSPDLGMDQLVELGEMSLARVDLLSTKREEARRVLREAEQRIPTVRRDAEEAEREFASWKENWTEAMETLLLRDDTEASLAESVLQKRDDLFNRVNSASELRSRIDEIDRDAKQFSANVMAITSKITPDIGDVEADDATVALKDRLTKALAAAVRREELQRRLKREIEKREQGIDEMRQLGAELKTMCAEARCESIDDLPDKEARSRRRRDLEQELKQSEQRLGELAAGTPLDEFVAAATAEDADLLPPTINQLADDLSRLESEKSELDQTIGGERRTLDSMNGSATAAEAGENAQRLLDAMRSDVEQFARLRLAAIVLRKAIEEYRKKNQGPIVERASELFAELTLGSFERIQPDINDQGEPVLVGFRTGESLSIPVPGMSDGTADQLYLAIRLASLEQYLQDHEPIPFIVDDILIKFDDDRAVAALKALARLSEQTQVIYFTHHQHIVNLAGENLDDDVLFTHHLDHREPEKSGPTSRTIVSA